MYHNTFTYYNSPKGQLFDPHFEDVETQAMDSSSCLSEVTQGHMPAVHKRITDTFFSKCKNTLKINPIDKSLTLAFVAYFKKPAQKRQY